MLKNISNLGTVLNKSEQQKINGGQPLCNFSNQPWNRHTCTRAHQPQTPNEEPKCSGFYETSNGMLADCLCEQCFGD